jgi:hypothetical protein
MVKVWNRCSMYEEARNASPDRDAIIRHAFHIFPVVQTVCVDRNSANQTDPHALRSVLYHELHNRVGNGAHNDTNGNEHAFIEQVSRDRA